MDKLGDFVMRSFDIGKVKKSQALSFSSFALPFYFSQSKK